MKIRLTESQHRRMVKEQTRHEVLADKVKQELAGANLERTMQELTTTYRYTEDEIINLPPLLNLVKDKMKKEIRDAYYISHKLTDKYKKYFNAVGEQLAKEIFLGGAANPYSLFLELDAVVDMVPSSGEYLKKVKEIRDGVIGDALEWVFDNFKPIDALKRASIIQDRLGYVYYNQIYPYVKQFADEYGIILFPKHRGMTFAKKDGMIRSLVNYIEDVDPKTKSGFLEYINSRGRGPGQHTVFWSAAISSGIIIPTRKGNQVTYELGPNYEAWENDRLVAF